MAKFVRFLQRRLPLHPLIHVYLKLLTVDGIQSIGDFLQVFDYKLNFMGVVELDKMDVYSICAHNLVEIGVLAEVDVEVNPIFLLRQQVLNDVELCGEEKVEKISEL